MMCWHLAPCSLPYHTKGEHHKHKHTYSADIALLSLARCPQRLQAPTLATLRSSASKSGALQTVSVLLSPSSRRRHPAQPRCKHNHPSHSRASLVSKDTSPDPTTTPKCPDLYGEGPGCPCSRCVKWVGDPLARTHLYNLPSIAYAPAAASRDHYCHQSMTATTRHQGDHLPVALPRQHANAHRHMCHPDNVRTAGNSN